MDIIDIFTWSVLFVKLTIWTWLIFTLGLFVYFCETNHMNLVDICTWSVCETNHMNLVDANFLGDPIPSLVPQPTC